ncbi:hypothetical protein K435DRAFT_819824 [Dendrothele bispora CBS 962.96]|uniref:Tc1-like transposase DDE domain-containing protein n=1 Tax=Dendrothele bispora (strain CBS 962.96) TaxID=1314807 RepID=A0A4S8LZN7_DENBC|nr:hypothetical protein K435DRAFT_819824 [Dendrothele bispora CBS 962.96]
MPDGKIREAPTIEQATQALQDLLKIIRGESRGKGGGYKDPKYDIFTKNRLDGMRTLLSLYTDTRSSTYEKWAASSLMASISLCHGTHCARVLRCLARQFIGDRTILPVNSYGDWNQSMLVDENEIGENISAQRLVTYLTQPDVMEKHGITREISLRMANHYLKALGFRFAHPKKGQFADGHERDDVVYYRERRYIPRWKQIWGQTRKWTAENQAEEGPLCGRRIIWYHKDSTAKLYQKGDGHSLMIADFVSADFGWLRTPDGRSAHEVMFPGKQKDGYFTAEDIQKQADNAINLVQEMWPEYEHIFIYDNATTHLKRPDGSLSAQKMPKGPSKNFFVEVTQRDEQGKPVYNSDGTYAKTKIQMTGAKFADGRPQSLYYGNSEGEKFPGQFKGMERILDEWGIKIDKKKAECKGFHCAAPAIDCCCRRILYNQPDFELIESVLETKCKERGVEVIFLPKFHCELNPIEQCWGYSKRLYRFYPESRREDDLKRNALECLDAVPLESIRRFFNQAYKFLDAYSKGLNGRQAAWAARKYKGHRVLPESLMNDMENEHIV